MCAHFKHNSAGWAHVSWLCAEPLLDLCAAELACRRHLCNRHSVASTAIALPRLDLLCLCLGHLGAAATVPGVAEVASNPELILAVQAATLWAGVALTLLPVLALLLIIIILSSTHIAITSGSALMPPLVMRNTCAHNRRPAAAMHVLSSPWPALPTASCSALPIALAASASLALTLPRTL